LGLPAIVLSLLLVITALGTRLFVRADQRSALLVSLLSMGFPWVLGAALAGGEGKPFDLGSQAAGLELGLAFMVLAWSMNRARFSETTGRVWTVWLGQITVLVALILCHEPLGLAIVASLLIVPCLLLGRQGYSSQNAALVLGRGNVWWLASMMAAALAVRF
jgi:hypothetical protein